MSKRGFRLGRRVVVGLSSSGRWNAGRSGVVTWSARRGMGDGIEGVRSSEVLTSGSQGVYPNVKAGFSVGAACRGRADRVGPPG